MKPIRCNCGRKFGSLPALEAHQRDFHKGHDVGHTVRKLERDHETIADRIIQAQLDEAMGVENYDREWLLP